MRNASSFIKSLIIVALIVALVVGGVIVYFNYLKPESGQPGELPSGGVSSGDIGSGDDIQSGDNVGSGDVGSGDVEDSGGQALSVIVPFDVKFSGTSAYSIFVRGDKYLEDLGTGEEVSFLLIFDYEDEILLPWEFLELDSPSDISVERVEGCFNTFKVSFLSYPSGNFAVCLSDSYLDGVNFFGESMDLVIAIVPSTGFDVLGEL